jgi:hypothetical protein
LLLVKFFKKLFVNKINYSIFAPPQGRLAQLVQSTWFTPKPPTIQTIFDILCKPL